MLIFKCKNTLFCFFFNYVFIYHACTNRTFKAAVKLCFHTPSYSETQPAGSVNASLYSSVPEVALALLCHVPVACRTVAGILVAASTLGWAWLPPLSLLKPARLWCHQELNWDLVLFSNRDEDVCQILNEFTTIKMSPWFFVFLTPELPVAGCSDCLFNLIF